MFFMPTKPSPEEVAEATWKHYQPGAQEFEFDIILRGTIRIDGVDIDCSMGNQGIGKAELERSCMLGFAGRRCVVRPKSDAGPERVILVGFDLVELTNVAIGNGGYADDIWFSRGYFSPNIAQVRIDGLVALATNRINRKRATVDFSGLRHHISITNSQFFRLGSEAADVPYRELPRLTVRVPPTPLDAGQSRDGRRRPRRPRPLLHLAWRGSHHDRAVHHSRTWDSRSWPTTVS
ncbi:hypothetical protein AB0L64_06145 [Kribbella sp. NPDC051936]|uniref:hypothetical protein n=1 Tax=Kribbella sp. NPDC051936 TaxID=3154946 RepID=UPI003427C78C